MAIQNRDVYDRVIAFYRDVIGLPVLRSWEKPPRHVTMLDIGNCVLEVVFGAEGKETGVFSHIALAVKRPEEVDAFLDRCVAAGCTLISPAENMDVTEEESGNVFRFRKAFCQGFAGETLEFFCER